MKKNADGKYVFPLKKPVPAHGDQLQELVLAEPDSRMVMDLGYPYLVIENGGEGGVQLQPKVAGRYLMRLAQVPLSTIEKLAISDLQQLQAWLMGFFGEGEAETESS
jgi:hypothetical protein